MEVNDPTGPVKGWKWADTPKAADPTPAEAAAAGHPEAKMSAAAHDIGRPDQALPPAMVDAFGMKKVVSPEVTSFMTTPLARPTGIDAVDSMLSPSSLAMMTFSGGPKAVRAVSSAVADLTEAAGATLTKKVLKFITPSLLKKPAELADLLTEIGKAVKSTSGASTPQKAGPNAAPAGVETAQQALARMTAQPPAAEPIASPAPASPAAEAPAGNGLPDQKALNEAALAARREAYQAKLQASGVPKSAAEALAQRFGLLTDAEMKAQIASRQYKR